jgi:hypothetical protein
MTPAIVALIVVLAFALVLTLLDVFAGFHCWLSVGWFLRMLRDVAIYGWTNRSFGLAAMILVLLGIGLIIGAAAVSAPWIYTIF